eukprot:NODE_4853_length_752_cov_10.675676_g4500_i0.p1 GENE.NODE_4853_length_752_cov_10.675676_g4500_i0~~NODE_4853_length_752_cov_10.675676_g4500_i0.p1  ORF type:complete len:207 (-),score=40.90 NODE_4853_length_752_cov_10.675676_g4500_i0:86-706(-)
MAEQGDALSAQKQEDQTEMEKESIAQQLKEIFASRRGEVDSESQRKARQLTERLLELESMIIPLAPSTTPTPFAPPAEVVQGDCVSLLPASQTPVTAALQQMETSADVSCPASVDDTAQEPVALTDHSAPQPAADLEQSINDVQSSAESRGSVRESGATVADGEAGENADNHSFTFPGLGLRGWIEPSEDSSAEREKLTPLCDTPL